MKWKPHQWADRQTAAPRKLQALLHTLASFADANGIAYPSQDTIMRRIGWSKGTIKKWSDVGRALGLFSTKKRFNPGKGHVDAMIYTLHLDQVVTAEEVATQIAELRFPHPLGKSQKWGSPSGGGKSQKQGGQIATSGKQPQKKELTKKAGVTTAELPAEGGQADRWSSSRVMPASAESSPTPARDWLLVTGPKGEA